LSDTAKIRERAEQVWRLLLPHLSPVPEALSKVLFEDLSKDLLPLLSKFLEDAGKGVYLYIHNEISVNLILLSKRHLW
jgi:hypothetical protein